MASLEAISVYRFLFWAVFVPLLAIYGGLSGRSARLGLAIGVGAILLAGILLLPLLTGRGWGYFEKAP